MLLQNRRFVRLEETNFCICHASLEFSVTSKVSHHMARKLLVQQLEEGSGKRKREVKPGRALRNS